MILHVTCLNIILNIMRGKFALVVFAVGHLLQLSLVTTSPRLPYDDNAHIVYFQRSD